ncbi:MAG: hypothetical protein OXG44_01170 [Gammaproteobacteria bacterium]|nr:hypothetical protein [Gammaproteobacteria bacterium]
MTYGDLNPVRAERAQRIEQVRDTPICDRLLENSAEALQDYLGRWLTRTKTLHKRQRAYGSESALRRWIADRALQLRETPLPA